ncbi:DNA ligase-1 [Desulfuromusa kysingii]|uniref:DNA ligase-1 n=1 Tax=Desulfuromusa kysingii TaxID=37625 RepID=A0A1H4CH21_9BACT|nr:DNA ligase [Desulfuromusa kysingii]SEA59725.1 DNA ligase-1 [Desulfuromusa kysingii]
MRNLKRVKILCLLLSGLFLSLGQSHAAAPMLPKVYAEPVEISGWLMSEKLDGVRGYWDGEKLFSKNGHLLNPPALFTRDLPTFPLEGELWGGRNTFEQTISIVKRKQTHDGWLALKFAIFDVPDAPGEFTRRIKVAQDWFVEHPSAYVFVIPQIVVKDKRHLQRELQHIEDLGGEGLIVRNPNAVYSAGRSMEILKVKSYQDAEATVIAHLPGKGRNTGWLGALLVELNDGTQFRVGTGFSDKERKNPPAVGEVITFKYYGKYLSGIPKFPSFLRLRSDHGL